ncbi:hypothetical protein Thpro_021319 [Acidihalobacter prosperus]|uniref:TraC-like protein n=2 Tax=Acidihalobacter prosperus TaxID=160660 RepID=A0A1A6C6T1_9GAMM|nr:hypothetical protein Thpro_021319 [Acidihalobacter prosperus]
MSKSERLLMQIESLKKAAKEAEKREREQRKQAIARAAVKAGIDKLDIPYSELEAAFRELVQKLESACVIQEPGEDRGEETSEEVEDENQDDFSAT